MLSDVLHHDAFEVENLASRQNSGKDFVFLGGGEDELGIRRRFLESLEESVERRARKHVHLVDDIHLVFPHLRRYPHLVDEGADVVNTAVGSRIELKDVERSVVVEAHARLALVARLHVGGGMQTIDGLRHDASACGLTHTSRSAEKESLRKGVVAYGVLQRRGDSMLTHDAFKRRRPVFSCRYDKIFHQKKPFIQLVKLQRISQITTCNYIFLKKKRIEPTNLLFLQFRTILKIK